MLLGENILSSMQQKAQNQIFQSEQYTEHDELVPDDPDNDPDDDDDGNGGDAGCGPDDD